CLANDPPAGRACPARPRDDDSRTPRPMKRRLALARLAAPAAFAAMLVLQGCAAEKKARSPRVPVTVATAETRSMPFALEATGTVEPLQTAAVGSQVGGVVRRIGFRE